MDVDVDVDVDEDDPRELQLLPSQYSSAASSSRSCPEFSIIRHRYEDPSSLDLQLSISLSPTSIRPPQDCHLDVTGKGSVRALNWQAAELIRLAAIEKTYTERVRELTRREVELAQTEFARARVIWERAREDMEKAKRMKDRATRQVDSSSSCCMEITCQSCRQRFRP